MTARALALEKQAQKLPATERERLAERLLVQMKHEPLTAVDIAWIAEAEKRFGAWKRRRQRPFLRGRYCVRYARNSVIESPPRSRREAGNPPSCIVL